MAAHKQIRQRIGQKHCKPIGCQWSLLVSQIVDNSKHGAQRAVVKQTLVGSVRL